MNLFEDTNPRALKELLSEIQSGQMVLPDFQRDFVWEPNATRELIVSIANNYPAGSLLRVRDAQRAFAPREFEGAPKIDGKSHTFLVLDGQQRMTSLYQAFFGVGEHRYYLNLQKLIDGEDFDEALFYERSTTRKAKRMECQAEQEKDMVLPLSALRSGAGGFLSWMTSLTNKATTNILEQREAKTIDADQAHERLMANQALQSALSDINAKWIMAIDDYKFPVVTLSDKTQPDALCTIFETLNRTGVKLSVFELLTARFWPQNINLRALWDKAQEDHPIITEYDLDPYYLLQAVALASRKAPSCKRGDVLNLTAADISEWWDRVIWGMAAGFAILRDDCKVVLPKWLPYQTMLAPLAAVLARKGAPKTPEAGVHREKLKRWFWCAVYGQAYESSPNTQAAKDVTELDLWLSGGSLPESVAGVRFDPKSLREVTPRQRAIYRGTICLVLGAGNGARDFHTQAIITGKLIEQEGIDDHHVFPDDYLEKVKGIARPRIRDCVLNRTLIDRTTNQIISNRAPSAYLADIRNTDDFPFDVVIGSHSLPVGENSPLLSDDFDNFLDWRQERLWQEIKRVTGMTEASDLEEAGELQEAV